MNEIKKENSPTLAEVKELKENKVPCPKCGRILDDFDNYCDMCGAKVRN